MLAIESLSSWCYGLIYQTYSYELALIESQVKVSDVDLKLNKTLEVRGEVKFLGLTLDKKYHSTSKYLKFFVSYNCAYR